MVRLFIAVITAGTLYGLYWFWAEARQEARLADTLAAWGQAGWVGTVESHRARGWPSRIDRSADIVQLTAPSGATLSMTGLETASLAYRPSQVVVLMPERMTATLEGEVWTISAADLRASLAPTGEPWPDPVVVEAQDLRIEGPATLTAQSALFGSRPNPDGREELFLRFTVASGVTAAGVPWGPVDTLTIRGAIGFELIGLVGDFTVEGLKGVDTLDLREGVLRDGQREVARVPAIFEASQRQ